LILLLTAVFLLATVSLSALPWKATPETMLTSRLAAMDTGMLGRRLALPLLGLLGVIGIYRFGVRRLRPPGVLAACLGCFAVVSFASVLWADDPSLVMRKLTVYLMLWIGAVWVAEQLDRGDLSRIAVFGCGATLLLCVAAEIAGGVFHPWMADYRLQGLVQPNATGEIAGWTALGALALATEPRGELSSRHTFLFLVAGGVAVVLLLLTRSRTAILATMAGVAMLMSLRALHSPRQRWLLIAAAGTAVVGFCLWQILGTESISTAITNVLSSGRDDADLATLSARTPLWHELLQRYIPARPLTGYGYDSFWTTRHLIELSLIHPGLTYYHAHSGYIELALSIGVPGAIAYVLALPLALVATIRRFLRGMDVDDAFCAAGLVYLIVAMTAEPVNFSIGLPAFLVLVILSRHAIVNDPTIVTAPAVLVPVPAPVSTRHAVLA
jgi:O-antigen ligase